MGTINKSSIIQPQGIFKSVPKLRKKYKRKVSDISPDNTNVLSIDAQSRKWGTLKMLGF